MKASAYNWKPSDEGILRISKSSLGTFGWCPQQYYLNYFARLPQETQDYHVRGNNCHYAVEEFYKRIPPFLDDIIAAHEQGYYAKALQMMMDAFPAYDEIDFRDERDPAPNEPYQYGEPEILRQLAEWEMERLISTGGEDFLPIGNELRTNAGIEVEIDGTPIPIELRGIIDRMFRDEDGGVALMELKTGKWTQGKTSDIRGESAFYQLMLEESGDQKYLPVTHWGWQYPGGGINNGIGPHWDYEPVKKVSMNALKKRMERLVRAHIKEEFPPEPNPVKCSYCEYMPFCPAWTEDNG